ncbi:MAG: hypothetical protein HQK79_14635 [Desulfobacterales bacterium]|nr:hypothetical protein [Desulfobacterales bacterium]MBF0398798.1 hypothetical protein [Desulfobacterales bacterium]
MNVSSVGAPQNIQDVQATTLKKSLNRDKELVQELFGGNDKRDKYLQTNGIGTHINITA